MGASERERNTGLALNNLQRKRKFDSDSSLDVLNSMDYERSSSGPIKENNEEQTKETVIYSPTTEKVISDWGSQVNYSVTPGESDSANTLATLNTEPGSKRQRVLNGGDVDLTQDYHYSSRQTTNQIISPLPSSASAIEGPTITPSSIGYPGSYSAQFEQRTALGLDTNLAIEQTRKQPYGNSQGAPSSLQFKSGANFLPYFPLSFMSPQPNFFSAQTPDYTRELGTNEAPTNR